MKEFKSQKILCVDDETAHLMLLQITLQEQLNASVVTANDGFLAFKKARNQKFDLIVTDYRMPRLDGNDLITALRETDTNQSTPILIYTGFYESILKELNPSYKYIDLLEKPSEDDELISTIQNLMADKSSISKFKVEKKRPKTDLNFLNSFIDATVYTLEQMTSLSDLVHQAPYVFENQSIGVSISANITMRSSLFSGVLGIGFHETTFLRIASDLLDSEQEEICEENRDAAGEIINIIYGQTKLTF